MSHDVVAVARRERVVLAAVIAETRAADGSGMLTLVAEDGARFPFPAAQALIRAGDVPQASPGEATSPWLARVRAAATKPVDWKALHAKATEGASLDLDALARLAGFAGDVGRLAVALASGDAEPWFRRDGAHWTAAPRADAEARVARVEATHRAHSEDEALRAWWPRRAEGPAPDECRGALDALRDFALRGQIHDTERGRVLAAKFDMPEPDQTLEALVAVGALPPDVNPAPYRAGLADGFNRAAVDDAERVAAAPVDRAGREDLTALHAVAVDDAGTTEVDDAVSIRSGPDGVEVLVHISDVAAFVPVGSPLDKAASARGSSLYMPESSVSMLPAPAVARLSLEAGVVREAVTGVFRVGDGGAVVASRCVRSLVKITRRLTYEQTSDAAALAASGEDGRRLVEIVERLRAARRDAGAIIVQLESLKVSAPGGAPHLAVRHQSTPGDLVVGELMVLFNREAARRLADIDAPAFYRTQDAPRDAAPPVDDPLYALRVRRRFAPSNVSIEPGRHHGVGADAYLQATSPIRRFADLVNQRQLVAAVAGAKPPYRHADLERLVGQVLERERVVRLAGDERSDYWVARAFERRVGGEIDGVLSRTPRRGLGAVWTPSLCRELPLRPTSGWTAPAEGTAGTWRISRVAPWRGRIELEPSP
jgi:exoribonuclease-2